ncbi:MAG: IPT/TIG domain-containing protein [Janthinobacterium lividum]
MRLSLHLYLAAFLLILSLLSCRKEKEPTPEPQITSFLPTSGAYATEVTIKGIGFSADSTENTVTFNGLAAKVLAASPTELVVRVPLGADTGPVSVRVGRQPPLTGLGVFHYLYTVTVSTLVRPGYIMEPRGIALDAQGNLLVAGGEQIIWKVTPAGGVSRVAGSGLYGYTDGPAAAAAFGSLGGIVVDAQGTIYVCDISNHCIRKVTSAGLVSTLAGSGAAGYADGAGAAARFSYPEGLALDARGNLLVADTHNGCIREVFPNGVVITVAGGENRMGGFADGSASRAAFMSPVGVAVDAQGAVYVADASNNRVRKVASGLVSTVAGHGQCGGTDGLATTATFYSPTGLALDGQGQTCVVENNPNRIRLLAADGYVQTLAGAGSGCSSQVIPGSLVDGPGSVAKFFNPYAVLFAAPKLLYVADQYNSAIRQIRLE